MAAQRKAGGLGKGLDELLEDNSPSKRPARPLVESRGEVTQANNAKASPQVNAIYPQTAKSLYETKPKTRSVKSNFKK